MSATVNTSASVSSMTSLGTASGAAGGEDGGGGGRNANAGADANMRGMGLSSSSWEMSTKRDMRVSGLRVWLRSMLACIMTIDCAMRQLLYVVCICTIVPSSLRGKIHLKKIFFLFLAFSHPTLRYPTLPYPTLPYPTLPYPTLTYCTLSAPVPLLILNTTIEIERQLQLCSTRP